MQRGFLEVTPFLFAGGDWSFMGATKGILVQWFTLNARKNNRAETIGNLFLAATEEYCWPSRVRTDKGRENAVVALDDRKELYLDCK